VLALNIETGANLALLDSLPEPEVKYGNTKDPLKRKEKEEEARLVQRTKMALDAHFGTVLCVGFATATSSEVGPSAVKSAVSFAVDLLDREPIGERALLTSAWHKIAQAERIVTFNGAGFDIPFMLRRSALLGVRPASYVETDKHRTRGIIACGSGHTDLMQVLHETETGPGLGIPRTLSFYAKQFFGTDFPYSDLDQSNMAELLTQTDGRETIKALCTWNVVQAFLLDRALQGVYP